MGKPHKNTPHVHAELIKAWADGAEIQVYSDYDNEWLSYSEGESPSWDENFEYRIKPEPKPDVVVPRWVYPNGSTDISQTPNLILTFDGETGRLKSAEVL